MFNKILVIASEEKREWRIKGVSGRLSLICAGLMVISLILAGQSSAEIDPASIVGIWLFDEGDGEDSSENGNDGELVGDIKGIEGQFGEALEFPGAAGNYVLVANNDSLALDECTATAWIKTEQIEGEGAIITNMPANKPRNYNLRGQPDGIIAFVFTTGMDWTYTAGTTLITDGSWHHVAGTYDGENARVYVDGKLDAEAPQGPMDANPGPVTIGGTVQGHYFTGIIDDVGLFSEALEIDDIKSIMDDGLGVATGIAAVSPSDKLAAVWGNIKVQ